MMQQSDVTRMIGDILDATKRYRVHGIDEELDSGSYYT